MEKISIIVPIYNVEKYIRLCVDSIINQTYRNIEIILVDDGSPDECPKICDEYVGKDSRIRVIHKVNGGLSDARNAGMKIATGDWLGFVDSDDYIHPKMYEILLNNAKNTNSDLSVCNFDLVKESECCDFSLDGGVRLIEQPVREFLCNKVFSANSWNKLYKRQLFDGIEFPVGLLYEDLATTYKIVDRAERVVLSDDKLYAYVQRGNSIMNNTRFLMKPDKVSIVQEMWCFFDRKYNDEDLKAGILEYLISDIFNMLGVNTWVENKPYRVYLNRFMKGKWFHILKNRKLSAYRKMVMMFSCKFPHVMQLAFCIKRNLVRCNLRSRFQ